MKSICLNGSKLICLLAVVTTSIPVVAQEPPKPGPEHKVLTRDVGQWKSTVEMNFPGQDEPQKSEGSEENIAVCSGLFLQTKFSGDFMGMPFEGWSLMGYDTHKNKYTGVWVDNFGTALYQLEGSYDEKTDTMTVMLTGPDPMTGNEITQKHVTKHIDEDTKTFEIFMKDPTGQSDEMVKIMSLRAERQK